MEFEIPDDPHLDFGLAPPIISLNFYHSVLENATRILAYTAEKFQEWLISIETLSYLTYICATRLLFGGIRILAKESKLCKYLSF